MQQLHHANEVRDFDAIGKGNGARLTPEEFESATGLIENYPIRSSSRRRTPIPIVTKVLSMFEEKSKGREITVPPRVDR